MSKAAAQGPKTSHAFRDARVAQLDERLDQLKREYDMFLVGQRRTEPLKLRKDVEREILELTRTPLLSTAIKFQVKSLAHRYRSFETQLRNLTDLKAAAKKAAKDAPAAPNGNGKGNGGVPSVVIDLAALDNPATLVPMIHKMIQYVEKQGLGPIKMSEDAFRDLLLGKAKNLVGKPEVGAVRFQLVPGESGPRVKGEIIPKAAPVEPSPSDTGTKAS